MLRPLILTVFLFSLSLIYSQSYNAEIVDYSHSCRLVAKKLEVEQSFQIRINNASGSRYAEIDIPYSKNNPIKNFSAWIEDQNGNVIRKLKRSEIETSSAISSFSLYEDDYIQSFKLIHNRFPYILKYTYTQIFNEFINIEKWSPVVFKSIPTLNASLTIELPVDKAITIHEQNIEAATSKTIEDKKIYQWQAQYLEPLKQELYAPPFHTLIPNVQVIPATFKYGIEGSAQTWKDYGKWVYDLNQIDNDLPQSEKDKIHALTDHLTDPKEKIKVLYHYLQDNHRYINVSIDIGGMQSYPASYVCTNRYGDCKALSNYLQTILSEIGIKAHFTLIYAGDNPSKIISDLPSPQFNHALLCVPLDKDTIWLECTSPSDPINYLGTFTQNRQALLVDENTSQLVSTPILTPQEVNECYSHKIDINETGKTQYKLQAYVKGPVFDFLKSFNEVLRDRDKTDVMDRIGLVQGLDAQTTKIERPHRDSTYVILNLNGEINHFAEPIGNKMIIHPLKAFHPDIEKPTERHFPVKINYPRCISDTIHLLVPKTIQSISGFSPESINTKYGCYSSQINWNNKEAILIQHYQLNSGYYPLEEYEAFYQFIRKVSTLSSRKTLITFTK
ncbi:DUF3857 domain-containing protein [Marinilabiliaceae bacterium JC017]|nr:DUF3857 domain-containing protein [Marinilabiliaceae bacterium JC017]